MGTMQGISCSGLWDPYPETTWCCKGITLDMIDKQRKSREGIIALNILVGFIPASVDPGEGSLEILLGWLSHLKKGSLKRAFSGLPIYPDSSVFLIAFRHKFIHRDLSEFIQMTTHNPSHDMCRPVIITVCATKGFFNNFIDYLEI